MNHPAKRARPLWTDFWVLLGPPLAAVSLVSLLVRLADLELVGICRDFILFYDNYADLVFGWLPRALLPLSLPDILVDYWALSAWLTMVQIVATRRAAPDPRTSISIAEAAGGFVMAVFLIYSLVGLLLGLFTIGAAFALSTNRFEEISDEKVNLIPFVNWLKRSVLASFVGLIAFFALNAYVA